MQHRSLGQQSRSPTRWPMLQHTPPLVLELFLRLPPNKSKSSISRIPFSVLYVF